MATSFRKYKMSAGSCMNADIKKSRVCSEKKVRRMFVHIGIILLPYSSFAQVVENINTDRPDQSDGVYILPAKKFQIETGIVLLQTGKQLTDILQSTMFRYGLSKKLEVRVEINEGFTSIDNFKTSSFGIYPVWISAKQFVCNQKGIRPAITAIGYLKIPFTASPVYQVNYFAPTFLFAFENDLSKKFELSYNVGITWDGIETQPSYLATASLSFNATEKLSLFAEYFSFFSARFNSAHNIDFGVEYLLTPRLQIDFAFGSSLFNESKTTFEAIGFSYRVK